MWEDAALAMACRDIIRCRTVRIALPLLLLAGPWCAPLRGQDRLVEGYAAAVNDRVILISDVIAHMRARYRGQTQADKLDRLYREARDALVDRSLILEEFETHEKEFPERAVDEQMEMIIRERFNNNRGDFLEAMAADRMTPEQWREQLRDQLIVTAMRQEAVVTKVSISPGAVRALYEERLETFRRPARVRLRMISVSRGESREDLVKQVEKIKQVRDRLKFGESFGAVAQELSEGSKARQGGDWGWREPDALRPELAKAVRVLPPGEVSNIVVAGDMYYLVLVEEREEESVVPFEEARKELAAELRRDEGERIYRDWVARLRDKHFVKVYTPSPFGPQASADPGRLGPRARVDHAGP